MSRLFSALTLAATLTLLAACGSQSGQGADSSSAAAAAPARTAEGASAAAPSSTPDARVTAADQARIMGDPSAKLWVVVVSDFQCPYCAQWERQTAPQLIKEFVQTGKVRLAFVNFPLRQHENALPAAEAAMCAGAQGKFWEMHALIFKSQEEWSALPTSEAYFAAIARQMALDLEPYNQCIGQHVMRPMILADVDRATGGGAGSTPTFFIGNQTISGAEKIEAFRDAIAKATAALPK
jgi:protein-disulfide isomerase